MVRHHSQITKQNQQVYKVVGTHTINKMKYKTLLMLEVEAHNEDEAIRKMYDLMSSGELKLNDIDVEE